MPLIIHVNLNNTLQHLNKDTHYRNLFETTTSCGSRNLLARTTWENNLFKKFYDNTDDHDRVKYGVLNLTNDPCGLTCCYGYGDSYLELKPNVKSRSTFVFGDSSKQDLHMCTFKYFDCMLIYINEKLLDDIIDVSLNKVDSIPSHNNYRIYVEAQIHGPIRLNADVSKLVVNIKHKNNLHVLQQLDKFSIKHDVPWFFSDDVPK